MGRSEIVFALNFTDLTLLLKNETLKFIEELRNAPTSVIEAQESEAAVPNRGPRMSS